MHLCIQREALISPAGVKRLLLNGGSERDLESGSKRNVKSYLIRRDGNAERTGGELRERLVS